MPSDRPFEVVAQFRHPNDAAAYLSALDNEGIEADLIDDNFSMLRTGLEFFSGGTKVIVSGEDAVRARELLNGEGAEVQPLPPLDFSTADLIRARVGRECPACGSIELRSPQRPALLGALVIAVMTAALTSDLPGPAWLPVLIAAALFPLAYTALKRLMPVWECNACRARWEMPRN